MSFDERRTYLCYNNRDLIRDGYIPTSIRKEYVPPSSFNKNRLKHPPKGVTYSVEYEKDSQGNNTPVFKKVVERKKLLPASKIKVEIDFSKVMKNVVVYPIAPGSLPLTPLGQAIATTSLSYMGMGGLTSGITEITFHVLDAQTKINQVVVVTQDIIDHNGWECQEGYPLSVFGIVKEHVSSVQVGNKTEETPSGKGLNFTSEQLAVLGKFDSGSWQGKARKRIIGATDSDGLFGGRGIPEVKFDSVKYPDQKQLFSEIVRDPTRIKFRADNFDATGELSYPPGIDSETAVDATDKFIRIDNENNKNNLKVGDKLYITYNVCTDRKVRQNLVHKGVIAQGNTIGLSGFVGAIKSEVDAFDYHICTWKVPLLPSDISYYNIDQLSTKWTSDSQYKLTPAKYYDIILHNKTTESDAIDGWRLSESITNKTKKFWAMDYRGIVLYEEGKDTQIILDKSLIIDQEWFKAYIISLEADGAKTIEKQVEENKLAGCLFDVSEVANSLLFDREKIPYHRSFANALKTVSMYNGQEKKGIGIINLDAVQFFVSPRDPKYLQYFDLSMIQFRNTNSQSSMNYPCETPQDMYPSYYSSENMDASFGPGAWYTTDYIDNQIFEWRPAGGNIESYWKVETPYFCGDFGKKSRVYTEKMGGNSLDNYSWIYVDTVSFIPSSISLDKNFYTGESCLVFKDDLVNDSLSYHKLSDSLFSYYLGVMITNADQIITEQPFSHTGSFLIGPNKILGSFPSYSHGKPITSDIMKVCRANKGADFWTTEDLLNTEHYYTGLDFSEETPRADIPDDWNIRKLSILYSYKNAIWTNDKYYPPYYTITHDDQKIVSLYFEKSQSSVSNIYLYSADIDPKTGLCKMDIDMAYYHGGPIQFWGSFWQYVNVSEVNARIASTENSDTQLNLSTYKIVEDQNAVVYDYYGKLIVFYSNTATGNIDAAVSNDGGVSWLVHSSLIRLIQNEAASFPVAIKDYDPNFVHLFYILNDSFIMYKRIDTTLFWDEDAYITAKVPDSYNVGDYDTSKKDYEKEYWGAFSNFGMTLRRMPSYFVVGSAENPYFIEQNTIKDNLRVANQKIENQNLIQHPRFEYSGKLKDLDDTTYNGTAFSVHMDATGVSRLFYTQDSGMLSIKRSNDYFTWFYEVKGASVHKIYKDDAQNEGMSMEIKNVQIVRDDYDSLKVSLLYLNNEMLFIRHFDSQLLFPLYDSEGNRDDSQTAKQLELTESSANKPIFLAGNMPSEMRDLKIEEIDNKVLEKDSQFLIRILYSKEVLQRFDEQMALDSETQPVGMITENGLMRIFYKNSEGSVRSVVLNNMEQPVQEVLLTPQTSTGAK